MLRPGSWSVAICDGSNVLPSGSLAVISFEIMTGAIVVVACFARCIFAPMSAIAGVFLLGEFDGVPIQFIKIILGLLSSILLMIILNRHSHPFSLLPSLFL